MLGPTRHQFDLGLQALSTQQEYKEKLKQRFRRMQSGQVPVVFSLMHLAKLAGVRWEFLRSVVGREQPWSDYKVYFIKKASGGQRSICVPSVELKAVQHWIAESILSSPGATARLNSASHAYANGCSILKNAKEHAAAPWMVKIDIHDFFESISERQVFWVFLQLGYSPLLAFEMARICTRVPPPAAHNLTRTRDTKWRWRQSAYGYLPRPYLSDQVGTLPQGAPTSPMLANLMAVEMDERVTEIASAFGAVYTRYADDLVISFAKADKGVCEKVLSATRGVLGTYGFMLNRKKTHVLGPGARKTVTGLVVNDGQPRLKRQTKNHIEVALHYIERKGLIEQAQHVHANHPIAYLNHLSGLIQFARWVEPSFGDKAFERLRAIYDKNSELLGILAEFGSAEDFAVRYRVRFV
jgi:RNA-directed DNA polymerase